MFPRYEGVNFTVDADRRIRDRQELDDAAARVRAGLAELEA